MSLDIYEVSRDPVLIREYAPITAENPLGYKETVIHVFENHYKNGQPISKEEFEAVISQLNKKDSKQ